jgi:hypothetical protein
MAQSVHPSLVANPPSPRWTGADHERCDRDGHWRVGRGGVCCKIPAYYKRKYCSREGCTSLSIRGGLCQRHGAVVKRKVKRCSPRGMHFPSTCVGGLKKAYAEGYPSRNFHEQGWRLRQNHRGMQAHGDKKEQLTQRAGKLLITIDEQTPDMSPPPLVDCPSFLVLPNLPEDENLAHACHLQPPRNARPGPWIPSTTPSAHLAPVWTFPMRRKSVCGFGTSAATQDLAGWSVVWKGGGFS